MADHHVLWLALAHRCSSEARQTFRTPQATGVVINHQRNGKALWAEARWNSR